MSKIATIACCGLATRWDGKIKQLLDLNGEPLISRMVRQLRERGYTPYILTHLPEVNELHRDCTTLYTDRPKTLCNTMLRASQFWDDNNLQLHGDVYWTDDSMDLICKTNGYNYSQKVHAFNDGEFEMFGFFIPGDKIGYARRCLSVTIAEVTSPQFYKDLRKKHPGQLSRYKDSMIGSSWQFYYSLFGIPFLPICKYDKKDRFDNKGGSVFIIDGTRDFGLPGQYKKWKERGT